MQRKELDLTKLSFREFKDEFYSRIRDFNLFDCGEINLLKVVLDGLKVNYVQKGWVDTDLFHPPVSRFLKRQYHRVRYAKKIKAAKQKIGNKPTGTKYLLLESGSVIKDANNNPHSQFFHSIPQELGRENCTIIIESSKFLELEGDLNLEDIYAALLYNNPSAEEVTIKSNLLSAFRQIKQSGIFSESELLNIKIACTKFYKDFLVWDRFLHLVPDTKKFIYHCHYHREGLLYALKKRNIECIELQHGLIATEDIFYVFPKATQSVCNRALFSDKILVYGEYWKRILLSGSEYNENSIMNAGYFAFNDYTSYQPVVNALKEKLSGHEVLLVTTQTFMHEYFIDYIKTIEAAIHKNKSNCKIIIKPHPVEKKEIYEKAFAGSSIVQVLSYPTEVLFKVADMHLSVYSTTLFDCTKYQIPNFTLYIDRYSDYVKSIHENKVAILIRTDENPFEKAKTINKSDALISREVLFTEYKGIRHLVG